VPLETFAHHKSPKPSI